MTAAQQSGEGDCPLCAADGGLLVHTAPRFRVVRADEPGFPGFWRVVWTEHVREFTDLNAADRHLCMDAVALLESTVRETLAPAKVNLAAFGNLVPHLHWHVVARFDWDSHWPKPVWAEPVRPRNAAAEAEVARQLPAVDAVVVQRFAATFGTA